MSDERLRITITEGQRGTLNEAALDEWTQQLLRDDALVTERHLAALLQPKPWWLPRRIWNRILRRVLVLQEQSLSE